ncbi:Syntaxin-1A, partial [Irineochytrium annulatum]
MPRDLLREIQSGATSPVPDPEVPNSQRSIDPPPLPDRPDSGSDEATPRSSTATMTNRDSLAGRPERGSSTGTLMEEVGTLKKVKEKGEDIVAAMDRIVTEGEGIEAWIARTNDMVEEARRLGCSFAGLDDPHHRVTPLLTEIDEDLFSLRMRLRNLGSEIDVAILKRPEIDRLVKAKRAMLARRLVEVAKGYRGVQEGMRKRVEGLEQKVFNIANATPKSDTHSASTTSNVFSTTMLCEAVSPRPSRYGYETMKDLTRPALVTARTRLDKSLETNDQIRVIEKSIDELVGLFDDMRDLIEAQDHTFVAIECTVSSADSIVEKGCKEIEKAIVITKRIKKCQ